jgi:opacity protein-like surface antigen
MRMLRTMLAVSFLMVGAATAHAVGISGVDGMTSTVFQEGQSSFSGLGLRVRFQPQSLISEIEIMPVVEYWRNSSTVQPYDIRSTRKDATLGVDARYTFTNNSWKPYVGVGYGLHFMSSNVRAPQLGVDDASDSVVMGGLAVLGGVSFTLTKRIDNFLELKYHHISGYKQLKLNWGLAFGL